MSTVKDRAKISIYMKLWELFNKSSSLREFELIVINRVYKGFDYKKRYIDEVLIDFFSVNGINLQLGCDDDVTCFRKEIVNKANNIYISFITKHFEDPRKFLIRVPKKSNLFYFESEQVDKILSYIEDASFTNSEKQDIVKNSLRNILNLSARDAIFFVNDKLFVRFFIDKLSKACEKRYNGIPEGEMEKLFERFKDINYEHLIENIAENIITRYLNPKTTDNITFHKKLIPLFQKSLASVFKKHIAEKELLTGFTNYVLRQNFNTGIYYIANTIIELIPSKDDNVKSFVAFYDGSEFREGDKKLRKSEILVDGDRWTFPPIYNLVSQKSTMESQFFAKEEEISRLKGSMGDDGGAIDRVIRQLDSTRIELEDVNRIADTNLKLITKLRKEYQKLQIEAKKDRDPRILQAIESIKADIKNTTDEDKIIISKRETLEKNINTLIVKRVDLEKRVDGANQKIASEMEKTVAIKDDYLNIKHKLDEVTKAFASAIMTFKL